MNMWIYSDYSFACAVILPYHFINNRRINHEAVIEHIQ